MPDNWHNDSEPKKEINTRTKLLQHRIKERQVHPSFDINGDGAISSKEFFIATQFDKGNKGYLDEEDRKRCLEALDKGYERNFMFGLEANVIDPDLKKKGNDQSLLKTRFKQIDGQIITNEDYSKLKLNTVRDQDCKIRHKTRTSLLNGRKQEFTKMAEEGQKKLDEYVRLTREVEHPKEHGTEDLVAKLNEIKKQ